MRVSLDCRSVRTIGRRRAVTTQTQLVCRLDQVRIVAGSVHIMTTEAGHASAIHKALNEVIPLHPVLVPCSIGEMSEGGFAQFVLFEPPIVFQV